MEYLVSFMSTLLSIPTKEETLLDFENVSWQQVMLHFSTAGDPGIAKKTGEIKNDQLY